MQKVAYNSSDSPIVISDEGHVLGGREWGPVETTEESVKAAVDAKTLIFQKDAGDEPNSEAKAAQAEVDAPDEPEPEPAKSTRRKES